MYVLKAILLGSLVAVHVVGAAFLFRRLFPRESRWLGFLLPEILVVLAGNFIEHHLALTHLQILLPFTTAAAVGALVWPKGPWRTMRLPTLLFLGAFAFTFALRVIWPSIEDARDGIPDLSVIANFLYGQTLPPESTWLPPIKLTQYYCLEHYGASLLIRLLGVDLGTGFNLSVALLSAYIYFLAGAVAWQVSRGKLWIVVLVPVLTACAATGDAGYLWLTQANLFPENIINPYSLFDDKANLNNGLVRQLSPVGTYDRHLLMPPGYGSWQGCFHSAQAGQVLTCFSILLLIELIRRKKTDWPWIALALTPFLMLTTCTWAVPLVLFVIAGAVIICRRRKLVPRNLPVVLIASVGLIVLLEPMLVDFLEASQGASLDWNEFHTQLPEFVVQWWLIYLPWAALLFVWRRLHPATRVVLVLTPLAFTAVEIWNFGLRLDTTAKVWGIIFAAAWITFLPEIARQRPWPFRLLLGLIIITSALSFCFWTGYYWRVVPREDIAHLDGHWHLRDDRRKARILETLSRLDDQIIVPGKSSWACAESALLPLFSHNRAYVAWNVICDSVFYPNGITEALRRDVEVNKIYDGRNTDPLYYLRQRNIAALVIYPDDNIDPSVVDHLKLALAPYYTYEDANWRSLNQLEEGVSTKLPPAGVFIFHPEINTLLGSPRQENAK